MKTWSERIKTSMEELEITQEELANQMGVTRAAIGHYLAGRRIPPLRQFERLASVLKVDAAWLQFGSQNNVKKLQTNRELPELYPIPVLSWDQITELSDIKKLKMGKVKEWVPCFYTDKIDSYALRIKGDSMVAPSGHMESFREGRYIVIDPRKKAQHNDFVIALLPRGKEVTFKQYVVDGGIWFLKPLNPQYPIIEVDEKTQICGVLTYHIGG